MANEIKAKTNGSVSLFGNDLSKGFENMTQEDMALPFVRILGQLSPQVTDGDAKYIDGAKPGMIYNTVTSEMFDGKKGIKVIPCYYKKDYPEWSDRGDGPGAPVAVHSPGSPVIATGKRDGSKIRLPNGNYLEETASYYVMVQTKSGAYTPALITMKSTQLSVSKKWNSMMKSVQIDDGKGGFAIPPMHGVVYNLQSNLQKNDKGSWYGWVVTMDRIMGQADKSLYLASKEFNSSASKGNVQTKADVEEKATGGGNTVLVSEEGGLIVPLYIEGRINYMKFKNIFEGLKIAYGQYQKGDIAANGDKQKGKAFIVRQNVSDDLWEKHLQGEGPALGIIPITEDNSCRWGCIDIDEYNFDHSKLIQSIRNLNLPLIVCRSKSGGAHVFLFTKEFISAALMQRTLKKFAKVLGYEGSEIFPKQTEILVERGDTGNFLNLPYYNGTKGLRYAINNNGSSCTLEEFYQLYDVHSCSEEEVKKIKVEEKKIEEAFSMGPPCLNKLASTGFGEGSRNNALFNIAVYYKQANPDTWEDEIVKANIKYMDPALSNSEVQQLIKSINRKGYDKYRCKDAPINAVCQSGLCRTKRFGVGFGEEEMPILGNLTKYTSNPPQWFLDVDETRIELKTEQLYSSPLFALACLDQANLVVPVPKAKDWKELFLKPMMQNLQQIEPLQSLDPINEITGLLQDWTTNRQSARTLDDIFNKLPFTEGDFTYFRLEDFYAFCKKNNWEMDKIKTGNLLKRLEDIFIEETRLRIKSQQPRVVKIKKMKKIEASISNTEYQREDF